MLSVGKMIEIVGHTCVKDLAVTESGRCLRVWFVCLHTFHAFELVL